MILSVFSLNVTLAEYFTAFTTMSMAGMTGQEQTTVCSFSLFLISVIIFVTLLAPRCAGSPSERFILCLVIFIFVSWMSKRCNVRGYENVELSKSCSRKKRLEEMSAMDLPFLEGKARFYLKEKQRSHLFLFVTLWGLIYPEGGKFGFIFGFSTWKLLY